MKKLLGLFLALWLIVPGVVAEVREDGYFATSVNTTGRGWNGDKYWLIKVPGSVVEHSTHNVKKMVDVTVIQNSRRFLTK